MIQVKRRIEEKGKRRTGLKRFFFLFLFQIEKGKRAPPLSLDCDDIFGSQTLVYILNAY
jgi:hypothetical protein